MALLQKMDDARLISSKFGFNDASIFTISICGEVYGGEWTTIDGRYEIDLSYVEGDIITVIISKGTLSFSKNGDEP